MIQNCMRLMHRDHSKRERSNSTVHNRPNSSLKTARKEHSWHRSSHLHTPRPTRHQMATGNRHLQC